MPVMRLTAGDGRAGWKLDQSRVRDRRIRARPADLEQMPIGRCAGRLAVHYQNVEFRERDPGLMAGRHSEQRR